MHLPYAEAVSEQVVVEWKARRRKGLLAAAVATGCMLVQMPMVLRIVANGESIPASSLLRASKRKAIAEALKRVTVVSGRFRPPLSCTCLVVFYLQPGSLSSPLVSAALIFTLTIDKSRKRIYHALSTSLRHPWGAEGGARDCSPLQPFHPSGLPPSALSPYNISDASSQGHSLMFINIVLLVVCVCIVVGLIFYLFYWNRFLAFIFSLILRLALWNQGDSSIWVEFGALYPLNSLLFPPSPPCAGAFHFSTLAGRILIKDLRYHSSNQTFRIVKVQLSWRYWIRQPAEEEDLSHARVIGEDANGKHGSPLGCRVHLSLQGLEWFMYNRTAAFDNIVSRMDADMPSTPHPTPNPDGAASVRKIFSRTSVFHDGTYAQ